MEDQQLLQFSRQIMLDKIDVEGQQKLLAARILVVGLGGLGSPVAMYLASTGVGKLILIDDDKVDLSNLQRQIVHSVHAIGEDKVASAAATIKTLNPQCQVDFYAVKADSQWLSDHAEQFDLVVDGCDNFATRFLLNKFCFEHKIPLVSGAAIRWEGQLTSFIWREQEPCYQCLYDADSHTDQTCSQNGVVAPLVGVIGSLQAMEAIKIITGAGKPLTAELLLYDALDVSFRRLKFSRKSNCPVCGSSSPQK